MKEEGSVSFEAARAKRTRIPFSSCVLDIMMLLFFRTGAKTEVRPRAWFGWMGEYQALRILAKKNPLVQRRIQRFFGRMPVLSKGGMKLSAAVPSS